MIDLQLADYLGHNQDRVAFNYHLNLQYRNDSLVVNAVKGFDHEDCFEAGRTKPEDDAVNDFPPVVSVSQASKLREIYENKDKPGGISTQLKKLYGEDAEEVKKFEDRLEAAQAYLKKVAIIGDDEWGTPKANELVSAGTTLAQHRRRRA